MCANLKKTKGENKNIEQRDDMESRYPKFTSLYPSLSVK
jgi:hypothetical protein